MSTERTKLCFKIAEAIIEDYENDNADEYFCVENIAKTVEKHLPLTNAALQSANAALREEVERLRNQLGKVHSYAKDREAYGRRRRAVDSARVATDLLAILECKSECQALGEST